MREAKTELQLLSRLSSMDGAVLQRRLAGHALELPGKVAAVVDPNVDGYGLDRLCSGAQQTLGVGDPSFQKVFREILPGLLFETGREVIGRDELIRRDFPGGDGA